MSEGRRRPGLGRGLSALLEEIDTSRDQSGEGSGGGGDANAVGGRGFRGQTVSLARIRPNPDQPRKRFGTEAQAELIDSVRRNGLLQPILVRPRDGGAFEIVAGERRWRAAQAAQLHEVPVVIRDLEDSEAYEIAIVENIQRQDLSPIEEARGYRHLIDEFGHTQEAVAELVGKSRSHIANMMRLLGLPSAVSAMVDEGTISMGHARALLTADDPEARAREVIEGELSVRQTEALVGGRKTPPGKTRNGSGGGSPGERDADIVALETRVRDATGLAVRLSFDGAGGQMVLRYSDLDELDRLVDRLTA